MSCIHAVLKCGEVSEVVSLVSGCAEMKNKLRDGLFLFTAPYWLEIV